MITVALMLAAPLFQEPEVVELSPVEKYFAQIEAKLKKSPALHLTASAEMSMSMGEESMPMGNLNFDIHFARPLNGWAELTGAINFMGMSEEISNSFLLDGKKVWVADHQQQTLMEIGDDMSGFAEGMPGLDFAGWWMGAEVDRSALSLVEDHDAHCGQTGLRSKADGMTTTTWFDQDGNPLSSTVVPDQPEMGIPGFIVTYTSVELPEKIDLKDYAVAMPEGYEVMDMDSMMSEIGYAEDGEGEDEINANLLAVGSDAPEVTFISMDDVESKLSDYRGKTVLMNFWFYH